ncbi:MAG: hypothetical protein ABR964_05215 [Tepidisphaeraceae bacterium]|jgi:hypothetical protein
MPAEFTGVELDRQVRRHLSRLIERLALDRSQLTAPHEGPDASPLAEGTAAVAAAIAAAQRLEANLRSDQPPQHGSRDA